MRQQHDRDSMSSDKAPKTNRGSDMLTKEENEAVFSMLGRKCQAQCTSVIQLFTTGAPAHSHWIKRHSGALSFVKDSSKRSYYFRLYCLMRGEMVWEQEMYDSVDLVKSRSFLLTFEGQDGMVAFNFASDDEANTFYNVTRNTMANRNRRREERYRRSNNRRDPPTRPPPATNTNVLQNSNNNNRHDATDNTVTLRNPQKQFVQTPMLQQVPAPFPVGGGGGGGVRQPKRGNRKLTKADISMPSDFKHVTHVGWNPTSGFDFTGEENDALQPFLAKAGVSDQQLKDRETRAFIYDFIQNHKVLESVKSDNSNPPPVPTRSQNSSSGTTTGQRQAPPPPPTRQPAPPPLPKTAPPPAVRAPAPSRPPPMVTTPNRTGNNTAAAAPPPPPPPPPMMAAVPPPPPTSGMPPPIAKPATDDPRTALMDSIRKGTQLKKIDPANESTSSGGSVDMRQDLMSEIRQGRELRPASIRELGAKVEVPHTDALAAALREALANRGRVIQSSDDDSTDSENDGEWDD